MKKIIGLISAILICSIHTQGDEQRRLLDGANDTMIISVLRNNNTLRDGDCNKPQAVSAIIEQDVKYGRTIYLIDASGKSVLFAKYSGTCLLQEQTRALFEKYIDLSKLGIIKDKTKKLKKSL